MSDVVCVLALHPDDETLGCGGTLLKHKEQGDEIHWVICTEVKEKNGFSLDEVKRREEEIDKVGKLYGFDSVSRLGLSTMKVDEYSMSDLITLFSDVVNVVRPSIVYLPFKGDVHSDHRYMFNAAYSCTKVFRYPFIKKIYMMEVLSETDFALSTKEDSFVPNVFVDVSLYHEQKLEIMQVYQHELSEHPFPRSLQNINALATLRGATAGCEYAESFMLLKEIK